jgi:hypothetical protein
MSHRLEIPAELQSLVEKREQTDRREADAVQADVTEAPAVERRVADRRAEDRDIAPLETPD